MTAEPVKHTCKGGFGKPRLLGKLTYGDIVLLPEDEKNTSLRAVELADTVFRKKLFKNSALYLLYLAYEKTAVCLVCQDTVHLLLYSIILYRTIVKCF